MRTPNPVRVGNMACERFDLDILGARVEMMPVRAEEYDARRRSRVADFSRRFSDLTPMGVACEIRAAGADATRAAR
jgi:hypothetical protein